MSHHWSPLKMWLVALRPDCKTGGRQRSQRDSYLEHIYLNILSYLSKCLIIFVSISYHICLNFLSYLSSMYYHICLKILLYLSQCLIIFVSISYHISLNVLSYLSQCFITFFTISYDICLDVSRKIQDKKHDHLPSPALS